MKTIGLDYESLSSQCFKSSHAIEGNSDEEDSIIVDDDIEVKNPWESVLHKSLVTNPHNPQEFCKRCLRQLK